MPANSKPDLGNLANCVQDAQDALLDTSPGPADPKDYQGLLTRLEQSRGKLPPLYLDAALEPFLANLRRLGETKFDEVLTDDPNGESTAGVLLNCAHAVLQHGEGYNSPATEGFQEVVSDLYDGFLSAEDRRGIKRPDRTQAAPLVKWGNADSVPYTLEGGATETFGLKVGIVSLPPSHTSKGLMGWAALGHETAGHEILSADEGLTGELATKVNAALADQSGRIRTYWRGRIEEAASDVMGVLNIGPAAGIGLIAYFRGLNADSKLSNIDSDFTHPPDVMRGYLAAETVRLLSFSERHAWAQAIEDETDVDAGAGTITMGDSTVDPHEAKVLARVLAGVIATSPLDALERHSLIEIQDWKDEDQQIAIGLRGSLTNGSPPARAVVKGTYAAHVVAAAVFEGLAKNSDLQSIFRQMKAILKEMHEANSSWGPIFIEHPGTLEPHYAFSRQRRIRLLRRARQISKQRATSAAK